MKKPVIRCSELGQLLSCGASRTLKQIVRPRDGGEGIEGQLSHWGTALRAIKELGAEPPEGGLIGPIVPKGYKIPRASDWLVGYFFNFAKFEYPSNWALTVELPLAFEFDRFILSGHQDIHGVNADATDCRGSDWKCVYRAVPPAPENDQVLGYCVLNALAYPNLGHQQFDVLQPRISEDDGAERISTLELDKGQIAKCVSSLNDRVNAALDRPMQIVTGLSQCAWCDAALQCPGIWAELESMQMTLTPEHLAKIRAEIDDGALGDIVMTAKLLERPIEDAMDLIKERIAQAGAVNAANGTRITAKHTGGKRKIIDPVKLFAAIRKNIPNEEILARSLSYPMGEIQSGIAEAQDIPKTGKKDRTALKIAETELYPFTEATQKTILQYS